MTSRMRVMVLHRNEPCSLDGRRLVLSGSLDAGAGQHVLVWIPGRGEFPLFLASTTPVSFVVDRADPAFSHLEALPHGRLVSFRGPFGSAFDLRRVEEALLVAGDRDVAPLLCLSDELLTSSVKQRVVLAAASEEELVAVEHWGSPPLLCTGSGRWGHAGTALGGLRTLCFDGGFRGRKVFVCGDRSMVEAVRAWCRRFGVPAETRSPCDPPEACEAAQGSVLVANGPRESGISPLLRMSMNATSVA